MRRRLLDLLVCPQCRSRFSLEPFKEEMVTGWAPTRVTCTLTCAFLGRAADAGVSPADCALCYTFDVIEGALRCEGCGANFPIINGVPRLLRGALLARLQPRYPSFFARHPEFLRPTATARDPLADTFESFTRQRLDLRPPGPDFAHEWTEHLCRNLGSALSLEVAQRSTHPRRRLRIRAASLRGLSAWCRGRGRRSVGRGRHRAPE